MPAAWVRGGCWFALTRPQQLLAADHRAAVVGETAQHFELQMGELEGEPEPTGSARAEVHQNRAQSNALDGRVTATQHRVKSKEALMRAAPPRAASSQADAHHGLPVQPLGYRLVRRADNEARRTGLRDFWETTTARSSAAPARSLNMPGIIRSTAAANKISRSYHTASRSK